MRRVVLFLAALLCLGWSAEAGAQKTVQYFDSAVFDDQLADSLGSRAPVQVRFPPGIAVASLPPRVNMWVAAVQDRGGAVQVAGMKDGKQEQFVQLLRPIAMSVISGFIGSAFPNAKDVLGFLRSYRLFRNLDGYDTMLSFDRDTGQLIHMTFQPRG